LFKLHPPIGRGKALFGRLSLSNFFLTWLIVLLSSSTNILFIIELLIKPGTYLAWLPHHKMLMIGCIR